MSKQSDAKAAQGFSKKPRQCNNCTHYRSDIKTIVEYWGDVTKESNKRCSIGGFAVGSSSSCDLYAKKT